MEPLNNAHCGIQPFCSFLFLCLLRFVENVGAVPFRRANWAWAEIVVAGVDAGHLCCFFHCIRWALGRLGGGGGGGGGGRWLPLLSIRWGALGRWTLRRLATSAAFLLHQVGTG